MCIWQTSINTAALAKLGLNSFAIPGWLFLWFIIKVRRTGVYYFGRIAGGKHEASKADLFVSGLGLHALYTRNAERQGQEILGD